MDKEISARLADRLVTTEPVPKGLRFAAVSIIIKDSDSPSVLLIRRAERAGDPWSGQVAFPGGKMQLGDRTARDTAIRETREEVGFDLNGKADFLGYAPVMTTHTGTMEVVPAVFLLKQGVKVRPNEEVASYRWVGLKELLSPKTKSTYKRDFEGRVIEVPAYAVGDYIVWGLTQRILASAFRDS